MTTQQPFSVKEVRELREGLNNLVDTGIFDDYYTTLLEHTIGFLTESITKMTLDE